MSRWCGWLLCSVLFCSGALTHAAEPDRVRIASEVWPGHTNADGSGLAWDIFRKVFEPAGVQLEIQSVPYTRSIGLAQRGEADAWAGSYHNEIKQSVFYPRWHYDADQIAALGLLEQPVPHLESLGQYRLIWMRGYEYQRYLPTVRDYREVIRRGGILGMLKQRHADFYIDALTEVTDVLSAAHDPALYRVTPLTQLPVYLGFADNPRGRTLAELFDKRMAVLVKEGSLRPIFRRWQQPYPFD